MKARLKAIGILVLILCGALASGPAMAWHGGHGYGHGGGVRFGISLGLPLYGPGFYPPYYGYPYPAYAYPAIVAQSAPPVYVEQGAAQAAPAQADWFYCAAANAYYPYVAQCPAGWQRVPAQPPSR